MIPPWLIPVCVVAFVVLILFAIIFRKGKKRSGEHAAYDDEAPSASSSSRWSSLNDSRMGDTLRISSKGLNSSPISIRIDQIHRYEQDDESWREFSGTHAGQRYALEQVDSKHAMLCIADELPLSVVGLSEDELHDEDNEHCAYNGLEFHLQESGEACYYEDSQGSGEEFFHWDFISADGTQSISIEAWSGEQPTVAHSLRVDSLQLA